MKSFVVLLLALVAGACAYSPPRGHHPGHGDHDGRPGGADKVLVCHKGKKTMELPPSAVSGHLGHGDRRGRC